jgi:hypothetical protein
MLYDEILHSGEPDAVYEFFWYNFKSSVSNFAEACPVLKQLAAAVPGVSAQLNDLKAQKKYDEIVSNINIFLKDFLWSALLTLAKEKIYFLKIASTNVKRWLNLLKIQEHPPPDLVGLKIFYSLIISRTDLLQIFMNIRGESSKTFDLEQVIGGITLYSYRHREAGLLNKLTQEPETQAVVVKTLRGLNLHVPENIRNFSHIFDD